MPFLRVYTAFVVIWLVFDRLAAALGSTRGERGAVVCAAVLGLLLAVERLAGVPAHAGLRALGARSTRAPALICALGLSAILVAFLPLWAVLSGTPIGWRAGWPLLAAGMWLQGGVAEEALFRGFLFAICGRSARSGARRGSPRFRSRSCMRPCS